MTALEKALENAGNAEDAEALQRYGSRLLRHAAGFALETLDALPAFTGDDLRRPTPCAGWDLWMLLRHLDDSLATLHEAVALGTVRLDDPGTATPAAGEPGGLVAGLRERTRRLAAAWSDADRDGRVVMVGGCPVMGGVVAGTGAVELAVHAWDVARTSGAACEIPAPLAERLLRLAPLLVPEHARQGLFRPPVAVPDGAAPGDRLVAFLGRDPGRSVQALGA
ncbi:TIGR03086 family metal-binding protein [Actinomadura rugatobispora]|uniref:TIGR03086 family metal-binding protein n=1 Tax=Actinomadura rugatobispora TaxID=1994 RepID=A0ABW1A0R0_9ACTN|nr:TIGR03086 family metal-binding protein [Actinomadura rugatobispora]